MWDLAQKHLAEVTPANRAMVAELTPCEYCQVPFRWERRGRKHHALNAGGESHWILCTGRRFSVVGFSARRKNKKKNKREGRLLTVAGKRIVGKFYVASCGCDVLPWEQCACSIESSEKGNQ